MAHQGIPRGAEGSIAADQPAMFGSLLSEKLREPGVTDERDVSTLKYRHEPLEFPDPRPLSAGALSCTDLRDPCLALRDDHVVGDDIEADGNASEISQRCLILFNESFAAHHFDLADSLHRQQPHPALFLRAPRQPDGRRGYKLVSAPPLPLASALTSITASADGLTRMTAAWLAGTRSKALAAVKLEAHRG